MSDIPAYQQKEIRDDRRVAIFDRLMIVTFGHRSVSFVKDWKYVPIRRRRALLRKVDELHRAGYPWPTMPMGPRDSLIPFIPRVEPEECRPPSPRPDHLPYCLQWTGAYWAPCQTLTDRKAAGYVPLLMCWPPPLPSAGAYLLSGDRARFAYRVAEVERFDAPRGTKRWTCRLWCQRVDPLTLPATANVLSFYWHPRKRRRAA